MNLPLFLARGVAAGGGPSISRTILAIAVVAVAISMATMVLASALVTGFKAEISDKAFGFWGHIHITEAAASYGVLDSYNYPISNQQDFYPALDTLGPITYDEFGSALVPDAATARTTRGGVRHIQQFIVVPGIVTVYKPEERLPTAIEGMILKGIAEDFDWDNFGKYLVAGEALRISPDSVSRGIVISRQEADRLQVGLGDRLDFGYPNSDREERTRAFTVTGIFKTGMEEYDRQFALVDIRVPRRLLNWEPNQVGGFEVFIDDIDDLEAFANYIHYAIPQDLYAESIRRKLSELFQWLDIQDYNWAIILTLMVTVAIINMMTALLILILERTNMIGTLKALGQSNWSIRQIFLYYAGFIVVIGLLLGNGIGLGLAWLQSTFGIVKLDEANYYLDVAPIQVDWFTVVWLNLGTLAVTLLFLVVPSYLVTRIDPVRAIRFQ